MLEDNPGHLTIMAENSWLYHSTDYTQILAVPDNHSRTLPTGYHWCVAHRPAEQCDCGHYALTWK